VSPVGDLIESFDVSYHQFADDTQLLVAMNVNDATPALVRLANCSAAVRSWFLRNDLQLNADKSEAVILRTAPQLRSAATIRAVEVAGSRLQVAPKLKSLGVTIDSRLRFDCHVKDVARACNYHTRALCHLRSLLSDDLAQTVAASWHPGLITATLCCTVRPPPPSTFYNGLRTTWPESSVNAEVEQR